MRADRPLETVRLSLTILCCALSLAAGAQPDAPGEAVVIPGAEVADWGRVEKVYGHFGKPPGDSATHSPKLAAVLILHGSNGVDGRVAYYAKALQEAGIASWKSRCSHPVDGRDPAPRLRSLSLAQP